MRAAVADDTRPSAVDLGGYKDELEYRLHKRGSSLREVTILGTMARLIFLALYHKHCAFIITYVLFWEPDPVC